MPNFLRFDKRAQINNVLLSANIYENRVYSTASGSKRVTAHTRLLPLAVLYTRFSLCRITFALVLMFRPSGCLLLFVVLFDDECCLINVKGCSECIAVAHLPEVD